MGGHACSCNSVTGHSSRAALPQVTQLTQLPQQAQACYLDPIGARYCPCAHTPHQVWHQVSSELPEALLLRTLVPELQPPGSAAAREASEEALSRGARAGPRGRPRGRTTSSTTSSARSSNGDCWCCAASRCSAACTAATRSGTDWLTPGAPGAPSRGVSRRCSSSMNATCARARARPRPLPRRCRHSRTARELRRK